MAAHDEDDPGWPAGTVLCGICGIVPAVVTFPEGGPDPMCNRCYTVYTAAQQTSEVPA